MTDEECIKILEEIATYIQLVDDVLGADDVVLMCQAIQRVREIIDERDSAWDMLEELKNSDIEKYRDVLSLEIKKKLDRQRIELAKTSEA